MMFRARVRLRFSAGHRLLSHPGKCRFPHGHSYAVELVLVADTLDTADWIEDFDAVKAQARVVIERHFDHAFIVDSRDTDLIRALESVEPTRLYILDGREPTAERIAEELFGLLAADISPLCAVRVWETEMQFAEYAP